MRTIRPRQTILAAASPARVTGSVNLISIGALGSKALSTRNSTPDRLMVDIVSEPPARRKRTRVTKTDQVGRPQETVSEEID